MAAIGSQAKKEITDKILEVFQGSFLYNGGKEIRIPIMEDGILRQIKCVLTCAKTCVESGSDVAMPGDIVTAPTSKTASPGFMNTPAEPSAEEKQAVADLISKLGLA